MRYTWDVHGMYMGCTWDVHGMYMGCTWDVHGAKEKEKTPVSSSQALTV